MRQWWRRRIPANWAAEALVLTTVAVALGIGGVVSAAIQSRMHTVAIGDMRVSYPARWAEVDEPGAGFAAGDVLDGGIFAPRVSMRQMPRDQLVRDSGSTLADIASTWALTRAAELPAYRVLDTQVSRVGDRDAVNVKFAYLKETTQGQAAHLPPRVMEGEDTLIAGANQVYILSFAAGSDEYPDLGNLHQQLITNWQVQGQ